MVSDLISTPVLRNQGSQFSACSTKSNFERTTWPTVTNMYDVERPGTCIMHNKFVLNVKKYMQNTECNNSLNIWFYNTSTRKRLENCYKPLFSIYVLSIDIRVNYNETVKVIVTICKC